MNLRDRIEQKTKQVIAKFAKTKPTPQPTHGTVTGFSQGLIHVSTSDGQQLRQQQGTRAIGVGDRVIAHGGAVFTGEAGVLPKAGRVFISATRKIEKFFLYMLYEVEVEDVVQGEVVNRRAEAATWLNVNADEMAFTDPRFPLRELRYVNSHPAFGNLTWELTEVVDPTLTSRNYEPVYEINEEGTELSLTEFAPRIPSLPPITGTTVPSSAGMRLNTTYEVRIPHQTEKSQNHYAYISGKVKYTRPPGATDTGLTSFTVVVQVNNLNTAGGIGAPVSFWIWDFFFDRNTDSPAELVFNGVWKLEENFDQFITANGTVTDEWRSKDGTKIRYWNNNLDNRADQMMSIAPTPTQGRRVTIRLQVGVSIGTLEFEDFKIHFQPVPGKVRAYIGAGRYPYGATIRQDPVNSPTMIYREGDPDSSLGSFGGAIQSDGSVIAIENQVNTGTYPPITALSYDWRAAYDLNFDRVPDYSDVSNPCTLSLLNDRGANVYNGVAYICDLEQIVEGGITLRDAIEDDPQFGTYTISSGPTVFPPLKYVNAVVKAYTFSPNPSVCLSSPAIGEYAVRVPTIRTAHRFQTQSRPASAKILSLTFQPPKKAIQN